MQSALPESVRKQYLDAMGIQTWYDPAIQLNASIEDTISSIDPASSIEPGSSVDTGSTEVSLAEVHVPVAASTEQSQTTSTSLNTLAQLEQSVRECSRCELHASRKCALPGTGHPEADLMLISLAPVESDAEDVLFSQQESDMLAAMLAAIGVKMDEVYMTSLVKCQPPQGRAPFTSEMICCDDHLTAQIQLVKPKAIMLLGEQPGQQLLVSQKSLMDLRLRNHQHLGVPVFVSYHPAEVTGSAETKRKVWQDLLQIKKQLMTGVSST